MTAPPTKADLELLARADPARFAAFRHRQSWREAVRERDRLVEPDAPLKQIPPRGDWAVWVYLAGRGAGKSRACAEAAFWQAVTWPGSIGGVIAPTHDSLRKVCFFGPSGLASIIPAECLARPINRSLMEVELWNGSRIVGYSAQEPERLRGPEFDWAWFDELAAFKDLDADEGPWTMAQFCLRGGKHGEPRQYIATTPKPRKVIKELVGRPDAVIVRGTSYENRPNLAPSWYSNLISRYEGTRLGRQEIAGEVLEDVEGALWTYAMIRRVDALPEEACLFAVGVDPSGSAAGNEAGVVAAATNRGRDRLWVIADRSAATSPDGWSRRAVDLWDEMSAAMPGAHGEIVVEVNFGGDMCLASIAAHLQGREDLMRRPQVVKVTASRGKRIRAEPIAMLYEQGRALHVGELEELEAEMCGWDAADPGAPSPNRVDSLVWAATRLMDPAMKPAGFAPIVHGGRVGTPKRRSWKRGA